MRLPQKNKLLKKDLRRVDGGPVISHLLFIDYCILFGETTVSGLKS